MSLLAKALGSGGLSAFVLVVVLWAPGCLMVAEFVLSLATVLALERPRGMVTAELGFPEPRYRLNAKPIVEEELARESKSRVVE